MEDEDSTPPDEAYRMTHRKSKNKSNSINLEAELEELLRRRFDQKSAEVKGRGGSLTSRHSSATGFNTFKKSIAFDSEYKEYEEEVKVKEPHFMVKRSVSAHGEMLLTALTSVSRKIEVVAMLPEMMSRLIIGDMELEKILGSEAVEAIIRLLFHQVHWIDYRNIGEPPFRFLGSTLAELKKRFQKGAPYPNPNEHEMNVRLFLKESVEAVDDEGESENEGEDEGEVEEFFLNQKYLPPTPSLSISNSVASPSTIARLKNSDSVIGPMKLGIPKEEYMADQLKVDYCKIFHLIVSNDKVMEYLAKKIPPEVTLGVKIFYSQIQMLEGLMYVKLLMTPEEEIQRLDYLKQIWVTEQKLLRDLRAIEEGFEELGIIKEKMMRTLNSKINKLISQIDTANDTMRYEINKISGDAKKLDLVNIKTFDQNTQQLDGTFQEALKFAKKLRAKYAEIEANWKRKREALDTDLETMMIFYDMEMTSRQKTSDDLENVAAENKSEIEQLEKQLAKIELRYAEMIDATTLKKVAKKKKKKGKKGKKGKKSRGRSKKKSKGKKKTTGGKKKSKKGKKKKKGTESEDESEYNSEEEFQGEEEEQIVKKKKKKKKDKNLSKDKSQKVKAQTKKKGKKDTKPETTDTSGQSKKLKKRKKIDDTAQPSGEEKDQSSVADDSKLAKDDDDLTDEKDGGVQNTTAVATVDDSATAAAKSDSPNENKKKKKKGKKEKKKKRGKSAKKGKKKKKTSKKKK